MTDRSDHEETAIPKVVFDHGIPGFPEARRFVLTPWGNAGGPFSILRSLDSELEFVVTPPELFFPDYAPEIDDDTAAGLGIERSEDALVLLMVTVTERALDATANLLGPLVINRHTLQAVQAVLGERWSAREPLFPRTSSSIR